MRDYNEKYYELNRSFPNKAGKLMEVITTQKRLIEGLASQKNSKDVEALILKVAEGYDVTVDILEYMKNVLQGVANDAEALQVGSRLRNTINDQNEFIGALIAKRDEFTGSHKRTA